MESVIGRTLPPDIFYYLLDLEVKRSRRYQNFFCLLNIKLYNISGQGNAPRLKGFYQKVSALIAEELRESDILCSLGDDQLVVLLPYTDSSGSGSLRSRFEETLNNYDLKSEGFVVKIDQISFPKDGTDTGELTRKFIEFGEAKSKVENTSRKNSVDNGSGKYRN